MLPRCENIGFVHRRSVLSAFIARACPLYPVSPRHTREQERAQSGMILERDQPAAIRSPSLLRLVPLGLGISVVPLDTSVNIAFPDITGGFGLPIAMIQWVVICYVLTHAGLMLALGRVGDMWGHGRMFRAGLLWSVVAFSLCAAAPSFGWVVVLPLSAGDRRRADRQLRPGAGDEPLSRDAAQPRPRRLHADVCLGSVSGAVGRRGAGGTLGVAGVFWFRAPIALTSLCCCAACRGAARGAASASTSPGRCCWLSGSPGSCSRSTRCRASRTATTLALFLFPAASASLVGFVWWEGRAAQPIVRIELFREAAFAIVNLAGAAMYLVTFSVLLFAPYFLVRYTALPLPLAGAVLATGFLAMAVISPLAGSLVGRIGAERVAPLGALATGAGLVPGRQLAARHAAPVLMVLALVLHGLRPCLFSGGLHGDRDGGLAVGAPRRRRQPGRC